MAAIPKPAKAAPIPAGKLVADVGLDVFTEEVIAHVNAMPEDYAMSNFSRVLDPNRRGRELDAFAVNLRKKVIGQDEAVDKLVSVYQKYTAKLHAPGRPVGNLLFLGPTGTGKTRTVEALAEVLFGDKRACIKVDCAEFQHSHEIAKLIGSPPGYLGHRETHPALTQEALNQWHTATCTLSILLFDEIEKASDALWNLLLGILDKATLTLGDNRRVDLSQCIIVLTSNLGGAEISALLDSKGIGFAFDKPQPTADKLSTVALAKAKSKFTPEFMNRIDDVVMFNVLTRANLAEILMIELGAVQRRLLNVGPHSTFAFRASDRFKDFLLDDGYEPKYGGRHLKRSIERNLVTPLSNLLATKQVGFGDVVRVEMLDGAPKFVLEPRGMERLT
jgi:ATP-dependent Clp protease ATP-binding subunit ClpB